MKVETTEAFDRALSRLPDDEFDRVAAALRRIESAFGVPHEHQGIRKLRGNLYEARAGLDRRIIFRRDRETLYLLLLGSHDDIRRFLKKL